MKKFFGSKKGWSLIELTIVIAIIAILAMAMMKGYGYVQQTRVSATAEQIRTLRSAAINWKATQGKTAYDGISVATLKSLSLVSSSDDKNRFNGTMDVAGSGSTLTINASGIPSSPAYDQMVVDMCNNSYFGASVCSIASGKVTCSFTD